MEKDPIDKNLILVTPVKKYALPKYPSLIDAKNNPDLLRKLPSRWQSNAKIVAAAGLFSTIMFASYEVINANSVNYLNVAPIFKHGDGTGSFGCVMIVPSVFLSEQEALAIIRNVAESGGLNFDTQPPEYIATKNDVGDYVIGKGEVRLKYFDSKKQFAVAYIPMRSAKEFLKNKEWETTVSSYYQRKLAEMTALDLAKQKGKIAVGILYEPGTYMHKQKDEPVDRFFRGSDMASYAEYSANMKELSEEDLRKQVRDFLEWLQGQGII